MSDIRVLRPAIKGESIRDPEANMVPLPEEGKAVNMTTFWLRRLAAGEVVEVPFKKGKDTVETVGKE